MPTPERLNEIFADKLPGYLGIVVTSISKAEVRAEMEINQANIARTDFSLPAAW